MEFSDAEVTHQRYKDDEWHARTLPSGSNAMSQGRLRAHRHSASPKPNQTDRTSTPVIDLPNFRHYLGIPGERGSERIHIPVLDARKWTRILEKVGSTPGKSVHHTLYELAFP
jgi:hypothetical protein